MEFVTEEKRNLEVIENVDVLVVGGGPGGVPAAVAAARRGLNVLIVERYGFFGGLATSGLMGPLFGYAPAVYSAGNDFFAWKDGKKQQLLGGIPVEIVTMLQKVGGAPGDDDIDWARVCFDPELLKHVCDWLITEANVNVLFHSFAVGVVKHEEDRIDAVIIESKSGRKAIRAKVIIDATGDGDIAAFAGESFTQGREADGLTQALGTKFIIGGVANDSKEGAPESVSRLKQAIKNGDLHCYQLISTQEVSEKGVSMRDDERTPTITRVKGDGTNVYALTNAELKTRRDTYDIVQFYRKHIPGFENAFLRSTPAAIGVRETRQIAGGYLLTKDDVYQKRKQPNTTIARGCWFFDIHCPRGLYSEHIEENGMCSMRCPYYTPECYMKTRFRDKMLQNPFPIEQDDYYDIPYGTIVPQKNKNLLISGRCICADHYAMSSARVIATCFAIAEAAGLAAEICLRDNISPGEVDVAELQESLRKNRVPLD